MGSKADKVVIDCGWLLSCYLLRLVEKKRHALTVSNYCVLRPNNDGAAKTGMLMGSVLP